MSAEATLLNEETCGLKTEIITAIRDALAAFPSVNAAVLYGSRAKGTFRPGSDIDLTLMTDQEPGNLLFQVIDALEQLNLPYGFDVSLFHHIDNDNLKEHIQRVGLELYNAHSYRQERVQQEKRKEYVRQGRQSEAQLEERLIKQLVGLGYKWVSIDNSEQLKANLKQQLEIHNSKALDNTPLSPAEFELILNHLDKGNVFARSKILRDRFLLLRDDGSSCYLNFLKMDEWCQNQFQVTHQLTQKGTYLNRYDVTLLINGLPLVQIELKRRGMELKEAFNQINRYQRHSFWAGSGLFNFVQLFVISNGANTKYYANNRKQEFKQTFFWSNEQNGLISQLNEFTDAFFEPCHLAKMICRYIVLHESDRLLMVLRPYQYYAVEAIIKRVMNGRKHGYIWHTTGSGKTLTSFKAAQLLKENPKVAKVVFVVDRADLDYQTTREFNAYGPGCVDGTGSTQKLVEQLAGENKLVITTIQKLNVAISKPKHEAVLGNLRDGRIVFIFDECHRSQFGDAHKNIVHFFRKAQLFGFTGTPIFRENAVANGYGKRTTKNLFTECLHKYVITDAIADDNVLKFAIEYWGKLKRKDGSLVDEQVTGINTREFFENPKRIEEIVDWIIANHGRKTYNRQFTAQLCVGSVAMLTRYYDLFKQKKLAGQHDLRVVTCFSFAANEDDADADGLIADPDFDISSDTPQSRHSREKLEDYVADYNAMYKTAHSVKDSKAFYTYYKDIAKRIKEREKESFQDKDRVDILLVVNMYLTGFDAKKLNTLYVDKNLKYHGLIQAYSRTNRILGELKSQGNIVCFRNLKQATDDAIQLFSDTSPNEDILLEPYEYYVGQFESELTALKALVATPQAVDELISEDDQLAFVKSFRGLMRTLNIMKPFSEFTWDDVSLAEQEFEDFKSKYLDIYDRTRSDDAEVASILDEVDFELELLQRDEINVAYILNLLGQIHLRREKEGDSPELKRQIEAVFDLLGSESHLRSKRELIEHFINDYMPSVVDTQALAEVFSGFWNKERRAAIHALCEREQLDKAGVYRLIDSYNFTGKEPLRDDVFQYLTYKPKLMERKVVYKRILGELKGIITRFDDHAGAYPSFYVSEFSEVKALEDAVFWLGDRALLFTEDVYYNPEIARVASFRIQMDLPYEQAVTTLSHYASAVELIGHGVVSDDILGGYFDLTNEFGTILEQYDISITPVDLLHQRGLFWSLTEVRQGSTVFDFCLNAVGYGLAFGDGTMTFLAAYKQAAEGFEMLKAHIKGRFSDKKDKPSMIITENLEQEFKRLKDGQKKH